MSVKPIAGTNVVSSASKMPESTPKDKVSRVVAEDKFPNGNSFKKPTRNITVQLPTILETDETSESPPQALTAEKINLPVPNPNTGLALRKLDALKRKEALARVKNNLK